MSKKYLAEFVGTFALAFVVLSAVSYTGTLPLSVSVIAGLTLTLFFYTIGSVSGCHINPAITFGLFSIKKISAKDLVGYILSQLLGAFCALMLGKFLFEAVSDPALDLSFNVIFGEMLGAFFFGFGVCSVVLEKVRDQLSGFVVGGSFLLGIIVATLVGSLGVINPAVALTLSTFNIIYIFSPIIGSVIGFQIYKFLFEK